MTWIPSWAYRAPGPLIEDGYYRDTEELTKRWYPDPGMELHTPGSAEGRWSRVDEAYAFLEELAGTRPGLKLLEVGESLLGVPIKALYHRAEQADAVTILIQARVHGNEPASTEGVLELAHVLAKGALADVDINVILLPVLNPEGARAMRRRTDTDIDPNRDYILHNSGSIRAVYRLMREYDPVLVLDMHEHDAYAWPYDLMTIGPNNPNIPLPIREFTAGVVIGDMRNAFREAGLRIGPYRLLDINDEGIRVRESATTFVSEKNAMAMAGRISLLTEGRGIGLGNQHFTRRTYAQYTAARSVLESVAGHAEEIRELVAAAREQIGQSSGEWSLRVEPWKVKKQHQLINAETGEAEWLETTWWDRSQGKVTVSMAKPPGYVIHASETGLMDRLRRFGLELEWIEEPTSLRVECMTIEKFEAGDGILYGGELPRKDGSPVRPTVYRNHSISVQSETREKVFPAGSCRVRADQANALYLLTLEPQVLSGFAALSYWGEALPEGFEFPVYRLLPVEDQ